MVTVAIIDKIASLAGLGYKSLKSYIPSRMFGELFVLNNSRRCWREQERSSSLRSWQVIIFVDSWVFALLVCTLEVLLVTRSSKDKSSVEVLLFCTLSLRSDVEVLLFAMLFVLALSNVIWACFLCSPLWFRVEDERLPFINLYGSSVFTSKLGLSIEN